MIALIDCNWSHLTSRQINGYCFTQWTLNWDIGVYSRGVYTTFYASGKPISGKVPYNIMYGFQLGIATVIYGKAANKQ